MKIPEISPKQLKARLDSGEDIQLIDVREQPERDHCHFGGEFIPLGTLFDNLGKVARDRPVVVYCKAGGRSAHAVMQLRQRGYENAINLAGGILSWIDQVDPTLARY